MATIDKLLKILNSYNVATTLDEEKITSIVKDVIKGYKIDSDSREEWLEINQKSLALVKQNNNLEQKDFPFENASKVVYPLITPAGIQLSSRLIQHIVRNDKIAECAVMGEDLDGSKKLKAERVSNFLSYEYLIESDTWLPDEHRLLSILSFWGTAFKRVYYDKTTKKICSDIIPSEDVIINNNTTSLEKCPRITIRQYLTKNEIISKIRAEEFSDIELETLSVSGNDNNENSNEEINPVHEVLEQFCYLDLDGDEYEEPYIVFVHNKSEKLLGIYPAFELSDVEINQKGEVIKITPRHYIVDYHLIDSPEGKFYSIGLNQLLYHQNESINSILRQLLDAGTLSNAASCSGFVTQAFKTREREINVKLGTFQSVEVNPSVKLADQVLNMPFREPSQVLLSLLQLLITSGKETGFITDILTGEAEVQNVPATTMLAMVEQSTRAFKPMIQKLYVSLKKEFKLWFHLHSLYLDRDKYFKFQDLSIQITKDDFDEKSLDICPVADPTQSSEARKYATLQAMIQILSTPAANVINMREMVVRFFTGLDVTSPETLVSPEQAPAPDPKLIEIQTHAQLKEKDLQILALKQQISEFKAQTDRAKVMLKAQEVNTKTKESDVKQRKMAADATATVAKIHIDKQLADTAQYQAETERHKPIPPKPSTFIPKV